MCSASQGGGGPSRLWPELCRASGSPWPHSTLLSSPTSFCWEHRPQQTLETLQEGHTMCIICMEMVEDSPSYTTMVCPSCKYAWFHRGCIHVGGPSLCQPAGTPCAQSGVLLTRGASSVSTLQAESPVWHECPRAQQGRAEPQPQPRREDILCGRLCEKRLWVPSWGQAREV